MLSPDSTPPQWPVLFLSSTRDAFYRYNSSSHAAAFAKTKSKGKGLRLKIWDGRLGGCDVAVRLILLQLRRRRRPRCLTKMTRRRCRMIWKTRMAMARAMMRSLWPSLRCGLLWDLRAFSAMRLELRFIVAACCRFWHASAESNCVRAEIRAGFGQKLCQISG